MITAGSSENAVCEGTKKGRKEERKEDRKEERKRGASGMLAVGERGTSLLPDAPGGACATALLPLLATGPQGFTSVASEHTA